MEQESIEFDKVNETLEDLRSKWPSTLVPRERIYEFSGGLINPRTMANLDSRGEGPDRMRIGKKVAYPLDSLIEWMKNKIKN